MKVGELQKELSKYDKDMDIEIWGVYGSAGEIEKVCLGKKAEYYDGTQEVVVFESDICSG